MLGSLDSGWIGTSRARMAASLIRSPTWATQKAASAVRTYCDWTHLQYACICECVFLCIYFSLSLSTYISCLDLYIYICNILALLGNRNAAVVLRAGKDIVIVMVR